MSENQPAATFFTIGRSRIMTLVLVGLHVLAWIACWLNALAMPIQIGLSLLVLVSLFVQLWRYNVVLPIHLIHTEQSGWAILSAKDEYLPVAIKGVSVLTTWVLVLTWAVGRRHRSFVIFHDALPASDYRRLFVTLRISSS